MWISIIMIRTLLIGLICMWQILPASVFAVTRDTATQGQTSTSPLTVSHTVTSSGGNRAIFILCTMRSKTATLTATYAGASATLVRTDTNPGSTTLSSWVFQKTAPATGANNWVVSSDENVSIICWALSATDVDQTTPVVSQDGTCSQLGTSSTVTLTSVTSDNLLIDVLGRSSTAQSLAQGADQTDEIDPPVEEIGSGNLTGGGSRQAGSAGGEMSWSWATTGGNCLSAINIAHSAFTSSLDAGELLWFE